MAYSTTEGRQLLLDALARATDALGDALAAAGEAYEHLDDASADRLEAELFGALQAAYAGGQRAHAGFAGRAGLERTTFAPGATGPPSRRARGFIDDAMASLSEADVALAEAQDAPELVEVGDRELRTDLAGIRERIAPLPGRARELVRGLGR